MKHSNVAFFVPHVGCPNQCSFCDQRSISGAQAAPGVDEVRETCTRALAELGESAGRAEIAFFGGSFTAIDREYMLALLGAAAPFVGDGGFAGVRLSTRPDAIDQEVLGILKSHGVTAIELGAQSMDDNVLRQNLRGHSADDVRRASALIKEHGFTLGLQMMVGLMGDTYQGALETAREIAKLTPQQVRIYPTVVLKNTLLAEKLAAGEFIPMGIEECVPICAELLEFFERCGIQVIRVGLHASETLERDMVGGCYHPAFRQLCESRIMLGKIAGEIDRVQPGSKILLMVNPRDRSRAVGQRRVNLEQLAQMGYSARIVESAEIPLGEVVVRADNS